MSLQNCLLPRLRINTVFCKLLAGPWVIPAWSLLCPLLVCDPPLNAASPCTVAFLDGYCCKCNTNWLFNLKYELFNQQYTVSTHLSQWLNYTYKNRYVDFLTFFNIIMPLTCVNIQSLMTSQQMPAPLSTETSQTSKQSYELIKMCSSVN